MTQKKENPISRETDGDSLERLLKINDAVSLTGLSDGVQAAYAFSAEEWRDAARAVAIGLAQEGEPFTVDDLRRRGIPDPSKPQYWGSMIAVLKNEGLVRLHSLTLHQIRKGDTQSIRVWVGTERAGARPS